MTCLLAPLSTSSWVDHHPNCAWCQRKQDLETLEPQLCADILFISTKWRTTLPFHCRGLPSQIPMMQRNIPFEDRIGSVRTAAEKKYGVMSNFRILKPYRRGCLGTHHVLVVFAYVYICERIHDQSQRGFSSNSSPKHTFTTCSTDPSNIMYEKFLVTTVGRSCYTRSNLKLTCYRLVSMPMVRIRVQTMRYGSCYNPTSTVGAVTIFVGRS